MFREDVVIVKNDRKIGLSMYNAKDSHIFPVKNNSVFVVFTYEILTNVT